MKTLTFIFTFMFSAALCFGQSCEVDGSLHSTFLDVQEILNNNNCNSCHGPSSKDGNWSFESYNSFLTSGDCNKPIIIHGNASQSYFYSRLTTGADICGESNEFHKISAEELDQIETWINYGAPEYCLQLYPDIKQTLDNAGCQGCHSSNPEAWSYLNYNDMLSSGNDDNCGDLSNIIKSNAAESLLYDKINNDGIVACGDIMVGTETPLTEIEIANIRDWINGGAHETAASLPVILSSFSARVNGDAIVLDWETEVEVATDKFEIERSGTGKNFEPILEVQAEGSTTSLSSYTITDKTPLTGENYYRLKILDLDGSYDYSNIRLVRKGSEEAALSISPNPAMSTERLLVRWNPQANQTQSYLNIVDANGQNLHRKIIFEGTNYVRLPALIEGVYYIIVEDYFGGFLLERVVIIN